jgi:hypothetical protein
MCPASSEFPELAGRHKVKAMFGFGRKPEGSKPSPFESSVKWAATAGAAALTFWAAAPVHEALAKPVETYTRANYGSGWCWLTDVGLWLLAVCLLFSLTRALIAGAVTTAAMWIAARFS